jgi:hypothetical protein
MVQVALSKQRQDCSAGDCAQVSDPDGQMFWGGIGLAAFGIVIGSIFILQHDQVVITVTPLDAASHLATASARSEAWPTPVGTNAPGLGLAGQF